jgi:hypothetical protein
MTKAFVGSVKEKIKATPPPKMVPNILFRPDLNDSDTEDSMDIIAAIAAKKGLWTDRRSPMNNVMTTARAVLMVRMPGL